MLVLPVMAQVDSTVVALPDSTKALELVPVQEQAPLPVIEYTMQRNT